MIGWRTWETVVFIHKGANYGFPLREGVKSSMAQDQPAVPDPDTLPVHVTDTITAGTAAPLYPVLRYGHGQDGGDAIAGGFVYRGERIPRLAGKFVFGDISTGRLWYADFKDMRAADDGVRARWRRSTSCRSGGTIRPIRPTAAVSCTQRSRRSSRRDTTRAAATIPTARHRARLRFRARRSALRHVDRGGELYLLSKSDGMIRAVIGAVPVNASPGNRGR